MVVQTLNSEIKNILLYQLELAKIQKKYQVYQISESDTKVDDYYTVGDNSYTEDDIQAYDYMIKEMIKEWHSAKQHDKSINEYIGMSNKEYDLYVQGGFRK